MLRSLHYRAPLLLIALAVGWELLALGFGLLAHSGHGSVLDAAFERFFLLLAVLPTALAAAIIVWRSVPRGATWPAHFRSFGLGAASLVALTCWIAASFTDVRAGMLALGGTVLFTIRLDRRLPPGEFHSQG